MARLVREIKYNFGPWDHQPTAWASFDKNGPTRLLTRAYAPLFALTLEWEKVGDAPHVVFFESLVRETNRWFYYHAAADKHIRAASAPLPKDR